jgi:prepilin-type N-terminal cleavage/methylation domain-containing protein
MRRGFSLVEVLVALSVAAVAVASTAHSGWSILLARHRSDVEQAATLVAERAMESLLVRDPNQFHIADSSNLAAHAEGEFAVQTVVEAGAGDNLWHLSIVVTPPRGGSPVRFHTLRRCRWSMR